MRLFQEIFLWLFAIFYVFFVMGLLPFGSYIIWAEWKNRRKFSSDISERINRCKKINVDLLRKIAKARSVKDGAITSVLGKLLADSKDDETDEIYFDLIKKMEEIEPYSELSSDVRASLLRIKQILRDSGTENFDQLLEPLVTNLTAHVELKNDYLRSKKVAMVMNIIGFISFIFGVFGIYLSISNTSPSLEEIKGAMDRSIASITAQHAPQGDATKEPLDK